MTTFARKAEDSIHKSFISFRVTSEEKEILQRVTRLSERSKSDIIREALLLWLVQNPRYLETPVQPTE
ncbi:MAG TPA: ribbon-helix-helix domain-containing protein [Verrucomicrobiae bacterium]|nr:ribbon-helix-helix domain-containing protein [Verrucomicrobiae bacterium]